MSSMPKPDPKYKALIDKCRKEKKEKCKGIPRRVCYQKKLLSPECQKLRETVSSIGSQILGQCGEMLKICPMNLSKDKKDDPANIKAHQECVKKNINKMPKTCIEFLNNIGRNGPGSGLNLNQLGN